MAGQTSSVLKSHLLGPIAQWLELPAHNRLVAGSNPAGPILEILAPRFWGL